MNTRQYPRTLGQAFPRTTLYACAVERPARNPLPRVLWWVMVLGIAVVVFHLITEA